MAECGLTDRLNAYHDGELAATERAAMAAHLSGCQTCAAELARLERLSQLVREAGPAELPAEALDRLHQAIDQEPRTVVLHMAEALAAVAASILILAGVWLWKAAGTSEAPATIPVWESVAVAPQDASAGPSQEQLAMWIARDLSRKNAHD
jgi:anti-sigma factor RsiW